MGERAGNAEPRSSRARAGGAVRDADAAWFSTGRARLEARGGDTPATQLEPWKPIRARTLFARESGAVASQFHDPPRSSRTRATWSAPSAGSCWARRAGSTRSGSRRSKLGMELPEEQRGGPAGEGEGLRHEAPQAPHGFRVQADRKAHPRLVARRPIVTLRKPRHDNPSARPAPCPYTSSNVPTPSTRAEGADCRDAVEAARSRRLPGDHLGAQPRGRRPRRDAEVVLHLRRPERVDSSVRTPTDWAITRSSRSTRLPAT